MKSSPAVRVLVAAAASTALTFGIAGQALAAPSSGPRPQPARPCAVEADSASVSGDKLTAIDFINSSTNPVDVYWLDYNGDRVLYLTLASNTSFRQVTYLSHPWVVTTSGVGGGQCIAVFKAQGQETTATVS